MCEAPYILSLPGDFLGEAVKHGGGAILGDENIGEGVIFGGGESIFLSCTGEL